MNKIIDDIMHEAENEAENIIAKAKSAAEEILKNAEKECEKIEQKEKLRCDKELEKIRKHGELSRAANKRNMLLKAKRDILESAVESAYKKIAEEYEKILSELFIKRIRSGKCVIYLPENFKYSDEFLNDIKETADKKGCIYTISHDRDIENGFIAVYGGIEENCTLKAIFEEHRDEIFAAAAKMLSEADI